jgi:GxxExxY protein
LRRGAEESENEGNCSEQGWEKRKVFNRESTRKDANGELNKRKRTELTCRRHPQSRKAVEWENRIDANKDEDKRFCMDLLFKKEVYEIVGYALEVLKLLGHGLHEKPYENALVVELRMRGIQFVQQPHYDLMYKNVKVGEFAPDLIAFNGLIVETKVIDAITDHERGQMLNYLRIPNLTLE